MFSLKQRLIRVQV